MSCTSEVKISQPGPVLTPGWLPLVAAGYLAIGVVLLWPLAPQMATHMLGSPFGDALLNAWTLAWDAERLGHGLRGLWQAPHFYPANDTLAWSEHLLGIAIFTAPIQWLTGNAIFTYNVALLGSVALAGTGMYLLVHELTGRRDAAWVAGVLFACLPYRVGHLGHLQVLMAGWMPLALAALHRFLRTGSRRALAGFVAAFVLQALSNGYFLFFLSVPVGIIVASHIVHRVSTRPSVAQVVGGLSVAALVILIALAPVIAAYQRVKHDQGFARTRSEMAMYSATPRSFVSASGAQPLWSSWLPSGGPEIDLFPGLTLAALAAFGLVRSWRRPAVRLYGLIGLVACVLALGPRPDVGFGRVSTGPYAWLLAVVPGMEGLRVPARLSMIFYLALTVLAGFGVAWALSRFGRRRAVVAIVLVSAMAVAEGRSSLPTTPIFNPAERSLYEWLGKQPAGPMLELPVGDFRDASLYLWATRLHSNRIVNGYSGAGWALQGLLGGAPSAEIPQAGELLRAARALGLRYVVVHPERYGDTEFAARQIAALARETSHVERVAELGAVVLVLRPTAPAPPSRPPDPPLPLARCDLEASHNAGALGRAVDGEVASRWLTGTAQKGDEWLAVRCRDSRVLTSLELHLDRRSYSDYPRRLAIDVSADGVSFQQLWEGGVVAELAVSVARNDRPSAIRIDVPAVPFRAVRLRQTGQTPRRWFWSIDELQLRGR